jgi:hypothetical protein
MSSVPANGKTAQVTASAGGRVGGASGMARKPSVDKPAAKPAVKRTLGDKEKKKLVIGVACLVVGLCVLSVYGYFNWIKKPKFTEPPLNTDAMTVVKFAGTPQFDALEYDRQLVWMDTVGDRKKELEDMFRSGKITQEQFQDAKAVAWLGKRLKQVRTYQSFNDYQKKAYLDKLINEDMADEIEDKKAEQAGTALPGRSKNKVKLLVNKLPEQHRRDYDLFKKALEDREDERKKEAKAAAKAAKAATQSTTRPTTRPAERAK